jgi:twitching motility protein PilU
MELNQVLSEMVSLKASDIYITVGAPVLLRVHGELQPFGEPLTEQSAFHLLDTMIDE